jgi:Ca2+-transporting ATPase
VRALTAHGLEQPWALAWPDVASALGVEIAVGLDPSEVDRRRAACGPNRLRERGRRSLARVLADQVTTLVVALLGAVALISLAFGQIAEAMAVAAVLVINTLIGFVTEARALRSMEALRLLARGDAFVRRGEGERRIPAEDLVPGDVVHLRAGDVVPADVRLVAASRLQVNESSLTGESAPVEKSTEALAADLALVDRSNMAYKGTAVTRGSALGVVVDTGHATELGRIAALVTGVKSESTPLEKRIEQLGRALVWLALLCAAFVAGIGLFTGRDALVTVQTAIALAVAAVPEGLPIVATAALARGLWRMARRNAVVERLASVETLGSTNLILTDKTGTLTENRMEVVRIVLDEATVDVDPAERRFLIDGRPSEPARFGPLRQALVASVLCNETPLEDDLQDPSAGDPLERALLFAGASAGLDRSSLLAAMPEAHREPFDPRIRLMATVHAEDGFFRVAVKGAPEAVIEAATEVATAGGPRSLGSADRAAWLERNHRLAEEGLRVIAVADKHAASRDAAPFEGLTLLALVGLLDPPRPEVRKAIAACRDAGIRIVMATGDQAPTARRVAEEVGLVSREDAVEVIPGNALQSPGGYSQEERERLLAGLVFARMTPEQKLQLLELHQADGSIVAMIGDGVNDAPALEQADIGVAMGLRGTQVAREAADMVLRDDRLETVVGAVEEGRVIFGNLRRFVVFLLSCNLSEILVVGLASLIAAPLPILPLQILFLNLVTDVFPALALGTCEGPRGVMRRSPRRRSTPILARRHWARITGGAAIITVAVLGAFAIALVRLDMDVERAVTVSFLVLAFSQLAHVGNMTGAHSGVLVNEVTRSPWVVGAVSFCVAILVASVRWPPLAEVLGTVDPGRTGWMLVIGSSLVPLAAGRMVHLVRAGQRHEDSARQG